LASNDGIWEDVKLVNPEPFPYNTPLLSIVKASIEFTYILKLFVYPPERTLAKD
jgi:hypothetical protein